MNLKNVQVGDTLIWHGLHLADSRILTVDRLTKTQVIIGQDKFRKSNGRTVGGSIWDTANVTIPKEGEIEKIQEAHLRQQLERKINGACQIGQLRTMSIDTLQRLNEVLSQ